MSKWQNVSGSVSGEIEIEFRSSGYYDPGKTSGLPENCYPPEGEDERTVDTVLVTIGRKTMTLPKQLADEIAGFFQEEIDDEEIDHSGGDEPDYAAMREAREEREYHDDPRD